MPLPVISGERAVRTFLRTGWARDRQVGSHKPGQPAVLSIHLHREAAPGTLRALIRASGMSVQQFQDVL